MEKILKKPRHNEVWRLKKNNSYLVTIKYVILGFVVFERDMLMFNNPRAWLLKKDFLEHFEWDGTIIE